MSEFEADDAVENGEVVATEEQADGDEAKDSFEDES